MWEKSLTTFLSVQRHRRKKKSPTNEWNHIDKFFWIELNILHNMEHLSPTRNHDDDGDVIVLRKYRHWT